jgi:hypothetical protein
VISFKNLFTNLNKILLYKESIDMHLRDKISKFSWTLLEVVKDNVVNNVMTACRDGSIKLEPNQLERLISVITASVDAGYHRGITQFVKNVDASLPAEEQTVQKANKKK